MPKPLVILTAGGSGGHTFPAEALASQLKNRNVSLAFITDKRGKRFNGTLGEIANFNVSGASVMGRGIIGKAYSAFLLLLGVFQSLLLFNRIKPDLVVGFGGYASIPACMAAKIMGIPLILHEQNAVLGRANRMFGDYASLIATSFPDVKFTNETMNILQVGTPVRSKIAALHERKYKAPKKDEPFNILVTGGSQGATILSEIVPNAINELPQEMQVRINLSQQCRPEDIENVQKLYETSKANVTLKTFFDNIPELLGKAHFVISRSGCSSIMEPATVGVPAILVPYKYSADDHQLENAKAVVAINGGWLIEQEDFTVQSLNKIIYSIFEEPKQLEKLSDNFKEVFASHDVAEVFADVVEDLLLRQFAED